MASSSTPPFKVKAAYDYTSSHEDDLSFSQGQLITVTEEEGEEWYIGEYTDNSGTLRTGLFPSNFVEKYEPAPPPRPSRSTRPKAAENAPEQAAAARNDHAELAQAVQSPQSNQQAGAQPVSNDYSQPHGAAPDDDVGLGSQPVSKSPPPVAAKSSSFKDRIAAFNKTAAPPPAPFKPSGLGSSGFIKKPFVAPPPSRNAYVAPPPADVPTRTFYRREEDPEIAERQAQDLENAERAGLVPTSEGENDEDIAKPVSLKERIALLQKQQQEQAARRGEATVKDKPSKPPRRREDVQEADDYSSSVAQGASRMSMDADEPQSSSIPPSYARPTPPSHPDDSHAADTSMLTDYTEPQSVPTRTAYDNVPHEPRNNEDSRAMPRSDAEAEEEAEEYQEDDEEEDQLDEETRHQLALRERMAKLSGGMGMAGMFGPPGGMPMMGMGGQAPRKRAADSRDRAAAREQTTAVLARAPSVPSNKPSQPHSEKQRDSIDASRPMQTQPIPFADGSQEPTAATAPDMESEDEDEDELPVSSKAYDGRGPIQVMPSLSAAPPVPRRQDSMPPNVASDADGSQVSAHHRESSISAGALAGEQTSAGHVNEDEDDSDADFAPSASRADNASQVASAPAAPEAQSAMRLPSRPVPPPPPTVDPQPRASSDVNRASIPVPLNQTVTTPDEDDDYDPYRYGPPMVSPGLSGAGSPVVLSPPIPAHPAPPPVPVSALPPVLLANAAPPPVPRAPVAPPTTVDQSDDELAGSYDNENEKAVTSTSQAFGTPPRRETLPQREPSRRASGIRSTRSSVDVERTPVQRRSTDQHRLSVSNEYIASEINLGESSRWWADSQQLPPVLQDRNDIFYETEESVIQKRGGKSMTNKEIYVLFRDYSQSVISVRYDSKNPSDVNFEQRHEPPPLSLRQDQLETAYTVYGNKLAEAASTKQNSIVGDGSPQSLVTELVGALDGALPPVGTRAYGALVYSNLANATVQQFDEIRPGDIVSFRNTKFQGKHSGVMHQKYQLEAGKPDHVAIVLEWDGTKKKIRAVEQGRDSKKCKIESFRLGDLRSGEVRVWRLMSRSWIGWNSDDV